MDWTVAFQNFTDWAKTISTRSSAVLVVVLGNLNHNIMPIFNLKIPPRFSPIRSVCLSMENKFRINKQSDQGFLCVEKQYATCAIFMRTGKLFRKLKTIFCLLSGFTLFRTKFDNSRRGFKSFLWHHLLINLLTHCWSKWFFYFIFCFG